MSAYTETGPIPLRRRLMNLVAIMIAGAAGGAWASAFVGIFDETMSSSALLLFLTIVLLGSACGLHRIADQLPQDDQDPGDGAE